MARDEGYIKISRKLRHWRHGWNLALKAFWIDLIMMANWEDEDGLKAGEFLTTQAILSATEHISRSTVVRYLTELEKSGEIKIDTRNRQTKITIVNWKKYQVLSQKKTIPDTLSQNETIPETIPDTNGETIPETIPDTVHPYLNNKEQRTKNKKDTAVVGDHPAPPTPEEVREYAESIGYEIDADYFCDYYNEVGWVKKNGKAVKDWKATLRNWKRSEKKKEEEKQADDINKQFAEYLEPSGAARHADWMDE
jgi:hypothetical protein